MGNGIKLLGKSGRRVLREERQGALRKTGEGYDLFLALPSH